MKEGDIIKRPVYAKTLEIIGASGGADIFYNGKFTKEIVKEINAEGGIFSIDDLKKYESIDDKPLVAKLGHMDGSKLLTVPPPAGGGAVMSQALEILSGELTIEYQENVLRFYIFTWLPYKAWIPFKMAAIRLGYLSRWLPNKG